MAKNIYVHPPRVKNKYMKAQNKSFVSTSTEQTYILIHLYSYKFVQTSNFYKCKTLLREINEYPNKYKYVNTTIYTINKYNNAIKKNTDYLPHSLKF